ncbi:1-acyl-sn-glycerol-3-phosphate acyltransferase [bacterium]|nr:1-acyl-sn-glycerol-3-phosphate acyltransferase [bacterium]
MKLLHFSDLQKLGKRPPAVRSPEEAQKRIEEIASWTSGPVNKVLSWIVQVSILAIPTMFYLKFFNKVRVYGREKLKENSLPYLFVSNHLTMFDDMFMGALLFLPIGFTKLRYFPWHAPEEQNFFLGPFFTFIMKKAQCVPLTRGHGVFQPGMRRLAQLLQGKAIVHIYPEGTRSRTGDINRGKAGVGRLAYQTKVKVIPCYHEGSQQLLPIGTHRLHIGKKVAFIVGDPVDMSDLYEKEESRAVYQAISDRMIDAIRDLRQQLHDSGRNVLPMPVVAAESEEPVKETNS